MDSWVIVMMMSASIFLGSIALFGFIWAVRSGQFDDKEKYLNGAKYDGEDELNHAVMLEKKKKKLKENYRPPD